jgi:hypothetical protein
MKRMLAWGLPMFVAASVAVAQDTEVRTETKVESSEPAAVTSERVETRTAPATKTETVETKTVSYDDRLIAAYRYAGIPEEKVVKLRAIDRRYLEARKKDPNVKITEFRTEQEKILTPEEVGKVRTYFREHRIAEPPPTYVPTTWEYVETTPGTGVRVDTPLGSVGVGSPPQTTVRRETTVAPE